ncbi:Restriction enzyme BgcI subunit beta [Frankliniella fusca]|uniref:Restriction enzyme BgcI subunit beta n=1 Tax=Frankliniella fusca TaxID=407009 RepID=A0AAE1LN70_9NEOP|nr:Restriction enzyme BgcI subunit beta [Frankliniella fusca]
MSKRKSGEGTRASSAAIGRQKYALVFYVADKSTGVVLASEIKSKPKLGSRGRVPNPYDWSGPQSSSKFDAILIKYGYDPEFLYTNVYLNKDVKEIKLTDETNENEELATRKQEEKLEKSFKMDEINQSNKRVLGRAHLFPTGNSPFAIPQIITNNSSASISGTSIASDATTENSNGVIQPFYSDSIGILEKENPALDTPTVSTISSTQRPDRTRTTDAVINATITPQPSGSGSSSSIIVDNTFNYEEFKRIASAAKDARKRALPRLECLIPAPNKMAIGENQNVYITRQQAINMPWVVYQPPGKKKCRVPEEQPTAVYPRKFITYLLGCLLPADIIVHLRGPTMPKILYDTIKDYLNGRMDKRQKISHTYVTSLISDCTRKYKNTEDEDD